MTYFTPSVSNVHVLWEWLCCRHPYISLRVLKGMCVSFICLMDTSLVWVHSPQGVLVVFRSTCPWKEGVVHSPLKHKLGRGSIWVHLCRRLGRTNQRFISRVPSILAANPEDNLQFEFYGLHCNSLLRSWVNYSFLLKEKEGILNDKKLLGRKKKWQWL